MSRKSRVSAPGTRIACHASPPLVVLSTVPLVPLAQATRPFTALIPRSRAGTPVSCAVQVGVAANAVSRATVMVGGRTFMARRSFPDWIGRRNRVASVGKRGPQHRHRRVEDHHDDQPAD